MALKHWPQAVLSRQLLPRMLGLSLRPRHSSTTAKTPDDIEAMLAKPTWSVESLFQNHSPASEALPITQKHLHHLLRLSALPLPTSEAQEKKMISDLQSQLRFVQAIQQVDTEGVEPLVALRDETEEAKREDEITIESLREEFAKEEVVGMRGGIRRRRDAPDVERREEVEEDALLGQAGKRTGRWVVVDTAKD